MYQAQFQCILHIILDTTVRRVIDASQNVKVVSKTYKEQLYETEEKQKSKANPQIKCLFDTKLLINLLV